MPIAFTTLGTPLASTSNATSYATASQSPTATRLLLAAVLLSRGASTDPVTPTLSGNGLTWALVDDGVTSGNQPFPPTGTLRYRLCLFQALTGGSPSAGALTVTCGGITHTGCGVIVGESNTEVDLADAIVQVDTVLHAFGAGPMAASMAAFDDANNAAFSAWALDITAAITHEGTELGDVTYSTPAARLQAQYLATQDTTPGVNWTGSANAVGIAVEVRIASVGGIAHELDLDDVVSAADARTFAMGKVLSEIVSAADARTLERSLSLADVVSADDALAFARALTLSDNVGISDERSFSRGLAIVETVSASDEADPVLAPGGGAHTVEVDDSVVLTDALTFGREVAMADDVTVADAIAFGFGISLEEAVEVADQLESILGVQHDVLIVDEVIVADSLHTHTAEEGGGGGGTSRRVIWIRQGFYRR